jgi:hypothetical protein
MHGNILKYEYNVTNFAQWAERLLMEGYLGHEY